MKLYVEASEPENLTWPQRFLELLIIAALFVLIGFFVYHQQTNTGFFTEKFGVFEMLCLYVPLLLGMIPPAIRASTGRRNPARPFEIAANALLALGSLWLLIVFPFNFAHLADTLPASIQFAWGWITNDVGKIPLALAMFFGAISALVTTLRYMAYRRHELTHSY